MCDRSFGGKASGKVNKIERETMNEMQEIFNNATMLRRSFLKVAAVSLAAAALAEPAFSLAGAQKAFAENPMLASRHTVTANLYAAAVDTPIGENAYVTNSGNPPLNNPTTPVSNNAMLDVYNDGTRLLTVPIVNNTFGVLSIASSSTDALVHVAEVALGAWTAPSGFWHSTPYNQRVTSITFDVTNIAEGSTVVTFSPCAEYVTFWLHQGDKAWNLHLSADLNAG